MTHDAISYLMQGLILGFVGLGFTWLNARIASVHKAVDGQSSTLAKTNETLQTALLAKIATPPQPSSEEKT